MVNVFEMLGWGALATMGAIFIALFLILLIALYIYSSMALMTIAKKTKTKNAWLAWIPVVNTWLIIMMAGQQWWQIFSLLLVFIPGIGGFAFMAVYAFWFWKISEKRRKPGWLGILTIIPLANLVVIGILAWAD